MLICGDAGEGTCRLVTSLRVLYRQAQSGQGWTGTPLEETRDGIPSVHDMPQVLGALEEKGNSHEGLTAQDLMPLQQTPLAKDTKTVQKEPPQRDSSASSVLPQMPETSNQFRSNLFHSEPLKTSAHPRLVSTVFPKETYSYPEATATALSNLAWLTPESGPDDCLNLIHQDDPPTMLVTMSLASSVPKTSPMQIAETVISSFETMNDWTV